MYNYILCVIYIIFFVNIFFSNDATYSKSFNKKSEEDVSFNFDNTNDIIIQNKDITSKYQDNSEEMIKILDDKNQNEQNNQFINEINFFMIKRKLTTQNFQQNAINQDENSSLTLSSFNKKKHVNLLHFQNKDYIYIYFWATWSIDSIDGLQKLNALAHEATRRNINNVYFIPIAIDEIIDIMQIISIYNNKQIKNLDIFFDNEKKLSFAFSLNFPPLMLRFSNNNDLNNCYQNIKCFTQINLSSIKNLDELIKIENNR